MTTTEMSAAAASTENGVLVDTATTAAEVRLDTYDDGNLPELLGISAPAGRTYELRDLERYHPTPRRKTGTIGVEDPESLAAYLNQHKTVATTLWAARKAGTVTAVLDDHQGEAEPGEGLAGWAEHRAVLTMTPTQDWLHWAKLDGRFVGQLEFAEHLDDGATAILTPAAADMIALAQTFSAKRNVNFLSAAKVQSGDTSLTYEETTQAKAGQKGQIEIPDSITLKLAPWEGCPEYQLTARFRYRLGDNGLTLGYRLRRPDLMLRDAFTAVLQQIQHDTDLTPYLGAR